MYNFPCTRTLYIQVNSFFPWLDLKSNLTYLINFKFSGTFCNVKQYVIVNILTHNGRLNLYCKFMNYFLSSVNKIPNMSPFILKFLADLKANNKYMITEHYKPKFTFIPKQKNLLEHWIYLQRETVS